MVESCQKFGVREELVQGHPINVMALWALNLDLPNPNIDIILLYGFLFCLFFPSPPSLSFIRYLKLIQQCTRLAGWLA